MKKAATGAAFLVIPLAALFWIHWYGLLSWFWADDFAWLSLHNFVHDRASLLSNMFEPAAQGTIRPWSERGFFLLFFHWFGTDALPYHVLAFATQSCNLLLLMWIVRKMGAPRLSASIAAVLWTANAALVLPLAWSSDYNQILCAFFLLAAFALYLAGYYWLQVIVFVLGFGALEINVVYPALLLAWLIVNRKNARPALPLIAISVAYYFLHRHFTATTLPNGPYDLHFDSSALATLYRYCKLVWVPTGWYGLRGSIPLIGNAAIVIFFCATLWQLRQADPPARFFFLWFLITLAPVLPLSEHLSDYYVAIPSLGLSAGMALWSRRHRLIPAVLVVLYLYFQLPVTRLFAYTHLESTRRIRSLVLGVQHARQLHPNKGILLTGVSLDLYTTAIADFPFQALNLANVYLAPDTNIDVPRIYVPLSDVVLPPGPTLRALAEDQLVVYQTNGNSLKNITSLYQKTAQGKFFNVTPNKLDVGNPYLAYLLGSTWYPIEENFRWMPQEAALRIAAPQVPNEKLAISGYCPPEQLRLGPLKLNISIDGKRIAETVFSDRDSTFSRTYDLPASVTGKESMEILLQVNRTFTGNGNDKRPKGLTFGRFEIRKQ